MFYCTQNSDIHATQYVHVDVTSDCLIERMFYYTRHSDMDAPQYVLVDVPSVYLLP
jgi:hypothetical protein